MTKRMFSCFMIVLVLSALTGCSKKYEFIESSEYHFSRDEYDVQHQSYSVDFDLEKDTNKVEILSECQSGTITISTKNEISEFPITVSADLLCAKEIELPEEWGDSVRFTISIDEETEGYVKLSLYSK